MSSSPSQYNAKKTAWENLVEAFKTFREFDADNDYVLYHLEQEAMYGGSEISGNLRDYVSENDLLSHTISHYGEPAQVLKCIEELAELQVELLEAIDTDYPETHAERGQILEYLDFVRRWVKHRIEYNSFYMDVGNVAQITSELADVSITASQMLKIFNCSDEVEKIKQEKLSRLAKRMNRGDSQ